MFLALIVTLTISPPFEVVNKCPPAFTVVNKCPAAPAVAARTFRGESFHAGHNCPNCGRSQYRIAGWVGNGRHRHACASCGTSWVR